MEKIIYPIIDKKIRLSLFVDPNKNQIDAVKELGVKVVEIHTGSYAQSFINNVSTLTLTRNKKSFASSKCVDATT